MILDFFELATVKNQKACHNLPFLVRNLLKKYPNDVWLKIDHNPRQRARVCPLRFHHIIFEIFIADKTQYKSDHEHRKQTETDCGTTPNSTLAQKAIKVAMAAPFL
jgi:hypothetical protein